MRLLFYLCAMSENHRPEPNYLWSLFTLKCPRCRRGEMFVNKNAYKKFGLDYMLKMHDRCPVCDQKFELETGFWYGTGYVSYGLTVLISMITFVLWWLTIGFSLHDDRLTYYLIFNGILVIVLQPWLMRFSRALYLYFFVKYSEHYDTEAPVEFN